MKDAPSKTSLSQKLGIKSETKLALIAAPSDFAPLLDLGDIAQRSISTTLTPETTLAICFVRSFDDLDSAIDLIGMRLPRQASVWIVHPKTVGKRRVGFNQNNVRDCALAAGLVDYKVCSLSAEWSGLKFAWRRR